MREHWSKLSGAGSTQGDGRGTNWTMTPARVISAVLTGVAVCEVTSDDPATPASYKRTEKPKRKIKKRKKGARAERERDEKELFHRELAASRQLPVRASKDREFICFGASDHTVKDITGYDVSIPHLMNRGTIIITIVTSTIGLSFWLRLTTANKHKANVKGDVITQTQRELATCTLQSGCRLSAGGRC